MINGLEGIPGSGKSYEATVYHVLAALQQGRMVITNLPLVVAKFTAIDPAYGPLIVLRRRSQPIRGTWDANRMDDQGNGNAFELNADGSVEQQEITVPVFSTVWDFWTEWKHPVTGQGPLFVIDECHVGFPKIGTRKEVIEWFKLHRHFNVDVLLMTQMFRDVCTSIAGNMEMLVKVRKASFMGKPTSYIRKVHAGYRGAVISTEERKYKPQFFGFYKSHTQGNSVAEGLATDVSPFLVRFKRAMWGFWAVFAISLVWFIWTLTGGSKKPEPPKPGMVMQERKVAPPVQMPAVLPQTAGEAVKTVTGSLPATSDDPEPLSGKGVHLKGHALMGTREIYVFTVSQNGQAVVDYTSQDLVRMGYAWKPTVACAGNLEWKNTVRAVTCDLPQVRM